MPLKLLHTADLHIGMKFTRGYEADVRDKLIQARLDAVGRLVQIANERECSIFVIAGDLFHNTKPIVRTIRQVVRHLKSFSGEVFILPGNHDFFDPDPSALWPKFSELMWENTVILKDQQPFLSEIGDARVAVYPGPCLSSHSSANAIGWVAKARSQTDANFHLGIAHGSIAGLTPDFDSEYFPMTTTELEATGVPLWLLGHAHSRHPSTKSGSGEICLYPSTPEPDGFDCRHEGLAWIITLKDDGSHSYEAIRTGQYRFHEISKSVTRAGHLTDLGKDFTKFDPSKDLVKLKLEGRIRSEGYASIPGLLEDLARSVLYLETDHSGLLRHVSQADIDREFSSESFPHRLLTTIASDPKQALALQMAYELIQGARS